LFTQNPSLSLKISFDSESVYALDTIFTISAVGWADEDLPWRYEFGCIYGDVFAIVQGSSEQLYAIYSLPAGDASIENKLSSRVRVYDSLGRAMSSIVRQIVSNEDASSSVGFILDVIDAVGQVTQSGKRRRLDCFTCVNW
jgi:hypothetical protein